MIHVKELKIGPFKDNGYMNGLCPSCKEWEAPITISELIDMEDRTPYQGSSEKKPDKRAMYFRNVWHEFFICPSCSTKFAVKYSDT